MSSSIATCIPPHQPGGLSTHLEAMRCDCFLFCYPKTSESLGSFGALLVPHLGAACSGRVAVWAPLGKVLGRLETVLRSSWSRLEVLWGGLGVSCGGLGVSWDGLGAVLGRLGVVLGRLGAIWDRFGVPLWPKNVDLSLVFKVFREQL